MVKCYNRQRKDKFLAEKEFQNLKSIFLSEEKQREVAKRKMNRKWISKKNLYV